MTSEIMEQLAMMSVSSVSKDPPGVQTMTVKDIFAYHKRRH